MGVGGIAPSTGLLPNRHAAPGLEARLVVIPPPLLMLGAAAIHFAAAPDHVSAYLPYGIFFILLGAAQVALAVSLVVAPSRRLYSAALLGTLAVIGLWLMSRTFGLPIAPVPWRPETIALPAFPATPLGAVAGPPFLP